METNISLSRRTLLFLKKKWEHKQQGVEWVEPPIAHPEESPTSDSPSFTQEEFDAKSDEFQDGFKTGYTLAQKEVQTACEKALTEQHDNFKLALQEQADVTREKKALSEMSRISDTAKYAARLEAACPTPTVVQNDSCVGESQLLLQCMRSNREQSLQCAPLVEALKACRSL